MNMEKVSLEIASEHLLRMTNTNFDAEPFFNEDHLLSNIKNGFVIITQLSCYFESFLNTVINSCMNYNGDTLLKCSIREKLDIIFMHYQKDWDEIRSKHFWEVYSKCNRVRNEMIHYKRTNIGMGSTIPNFIIGGQNVADFFTQDNLSYIIEQHIKLAETIAMVLGLRIDHDIPIFQCDARDSLVNYVHDD